MDGKIDVCIYCRRDVDLKKGEGDHVIPAALGRFREELIFRRICRGCNSQIGKCEEQLLRCAPEAFMRRLVPAAVKRNKRGRSWVGANGMPAPLGMINHDDHHEYVNIDPNNPENVRSFDQLVIIDQDKGEHYIRLNPQMTVEHLRSKINNLEIVPSDKIYLHADDDTYPIYVGLINEMWPDRQVANGESREAGVHCVAGKTKFTFHADYWRAIAKIGFHYYLVNSQRGIRGDELEFADIRNFIIEGGNHEPFFTNPKARILTPFVELPDGRACLPSNWVHILAAVETPGNAVVSVVSLFTGPQRLPPNYHINLGLLRSPNDVPVAQFSHAYVYEAEPREDGYAGHVVSQTPTQMR